MEKLSNFLQQCTCKLPFTAMHSRSNLSKLPFTAMHSRSNLSKLPFTAMHSCSNLSKLPFTAMHSCSNLSKLLPQNLYSWKAQALVYFHSTCSQFHLYATPPWGHLPGVLDVFKNYQFCQYYVRVKHYLASGIIQLI